MSCGWTANFEQLQCLMIDRPVIELRLDREF